MGAAPAQAPAQPLSAVLPGQSGRPSLKLLAERILGVSVQHAEHCSVSVLGGQPLGLGAVPDLAADAVGPGQLLF